MKVAVIGGGWAGLTAALALRDAGLARVTVFEAGQGPGGRARRIEHPGFPAGLDNGQHILLGAYHDTQALITRLRRDAPERPLVRYPLHLESLDGSFKLRAPPHLPAPLHMLLALAGARGLSLAARWQAVRLMLTLQRWRWQVPADWSVEQLLKRLRQGPALRQRLWHPLCLAAMNTPVHAASAALFVRVLRDGLAGSRQASDLLFPACDLGALWPDAAVQQLDWRPGVPIRNIHALASGWRIGPDMPAGSATATPEDDTYDAVILAVPPPQAARLLQGLPDAPGAGALLQALHAFEFEAIATLNLRLAAAWRLPFPMMQLDDQHGLQPGHWIFDRAMLTGRSECGEISIVGSVAGPYLARGRDALAQAMDAQWRAQWQARTARAVTQPPPPDTCARALIVEKRATFAARPGLFRPGATSPWPRLYLAGDWTDTGYPGVLEGAVRSGQEAARRLLGNR
ncbi:hydroxysqualene dehydroxylase HpnE [Kerstersia similis]|uniref:hydroxysqualene dehydroxylase HpnE n=1 Tax=Kerstersia similis TaxID=206505 RepID=UPI0039EFF6AB